MLSAALEHDEFVVRLSDDGAGINWDKLAQKAPDRGLPFEPKPSGSTSCPRTASRRSTRPARFWPRRRHGGGAGRGQPPQRQNQVTSQAGTDHDRDAFPVQRDVARQAGTRASRPDLLVRNPQRVPRLPRAAG